MKKKEIIKSISFESAEEVCNFLKSNLNKVLFITDAGQYYHNYTVFSKEKTA